MLICDGVYPWLTALCPVLMVLFSSFAQMLGEQDIFFGVLLLSPIALLFGAQAVFFGVLLVLNGVWLYKRLKDPASPLETKAMFIIKLVQIPAFAATFLIGMVTVAFIALPLVLLLFNAFAVVLTGLPSAGNAVLLYRRGVLSRWAAIVLGALSFVFCADVAAAVILWWLSRRAVA